jgi:hypothetical protein
MFLDFFTVESTGIIHILGNVLEKLMVSFAGDVVSNYSLIEIYNLNGTATYHTALRA